ncbi:MAG: Uma2 family endonuclease [Oscillospiraceae bacterium]|nr:Uma2 family endonuclease [Oscillospiraceae bacterium]
MGLPQEKDVRYTYADYLEWDDSERYELIEGVPYIMASPSEAHQTMLLEFASQFHAFLKGKPCKGFIAPFDVRLFPQNSHDDDTIVQPDFLVVCDNSKLDGKACNGAPDFVLEILSPSTSRKDRILKKAQYGWAGVKEYWIIGPKDRMLEKHVLENGKYTHEWLDASVPVPVSIFPGFAIDLSLVFGEEEP